MIDEGRRRSDRDLRIALVADRFSPADGESRVRHLGGALVAQGHQVTVLTHDTDDARAFEVVDGVVVHRFLPLLPDRPDLLSPGMARHLARGEATYDVVHVHGCDTPAEAIARWWDGPLVLSPQLPGTRPSRMRLALDRARRCVGRHVAARSDAVVCESESERRVVSEQFPDTVGKIAVVPDGLDVARLRSVPWAPCDGRRLVLVAGRLDAEARVDRVISALSMLGPDHRLEICGDGPERSALEQQVALQGLASAVRFRGVVDDDELVSSLRAAACLVRLADHDPRDIGVLAAAAVGTPSVATATPAHVEARVRVGELVTLVPEIGSMRLLTESIRQASVARWFPVDLPGWVEVGDRVTDLYRDAIATSARSHQPA